ncbi:RagB/SusD family nutrient uptake outer membrane protein [Marinifilum sp. D714]|uniref:RagB/SusD family nutrient uptake outer membrane protein n=1 Tax=Marinifilum sp. D714 TaxID=2937523 RepID=UPI0027CC4BCC|nr:RagB/SusD family nutrient uptake outer membrane protein [Marinifilum sp. D714]MDQ2178948.1 RagB/SusD family nutrient uptake outer membrane protein [Marinifilum sp. D714]
MKNITYIGLLVLGLASCSDFLDIEDETKISNDKLFSTLNGADEALNGTYYELGNGSYYGKDMIIAPEIKGGNLKVNNISFENAKSYNYLPSFEFTHTVKGEADYMSNFYKHLYRVISYANNVIENIENVADATEQEKAQIEAEARAIRALAHFDLTRFYAQPYSYTANAQHLGVPYMLRNIRYDELVTRDLLFDNYENIIADLVYAEGNLGTAIGNVGASYSKAYMSKLAAQALLARVYLYKGDWERARQYATKVIEDGEVSLLSTAEFVESFSKQEPSREDIFIVDNSGRKIGAPLSDIIGISEARTSLYLLPTNDIIELYNDGDVRGELFDVQMEAQLTKKWVEFADQDNHISVLRLAEMFLIRAEASLNLPVRDEVQARADLDVIRKRANPNAENLQLSGFALDEELFNERRRELAFEGHLFFDIARMGRNLHRVDCNARENINIDYPNNLFVLPIPEDAIEFNDQMEQNPGY